MQSQGLDPTVGAILPLVGVLLGGLITAWVTWLFERRRETAAARTAARMVMGELSKANADIGRASLNRDWRPLDELATAQYDKRGELLAAALHDEQWIALYHAYAQIGFAQWLLALRRTLPMRDGDVANLTDAQATIDAGAHAINSLASHVPPRRRIRSPGRS